jgi:hypothetical protein
MRSYCTGETRVESRRARGSSRRRGSCLRRLLYHRWGKNSCRRGQQARPFRRCNPQCGHRLSREPGGDGARSSERLRCQCARALHSDGTDRKTEAIGLSELRHASRRASANGRSALDQATLERLVSLRGEAPARRAVRPASSRCSGNQRWLRLKPPSTARKASRTASRYIEVHGLRFCPPTAIGEGTPQEFVSR